MQFPLEDDDARRLTSAQDHRSLKKGHCRRHVDQYQCDEALAVAALKRWRKPMTIKYIVAIALITAVLSVSSMAQQYQGGPKSSFMPTRQISSGGDIYAQGDVYPRGVAAKKSSAGGGSHHYSGGPRSDPHHMGPKQ
jgi:hypothetical protein